MAGTHFGGGNAKDAVSSDLFVYVYRCTYYWARLEDPPYEMRGPGFRACSALTSGHDIHS